MIDKHYNTTADIYRVSSSIDQNNFEIEEMSLLSSIKCYIEPLNGSEVYVSDKWESKTTHRLFAPVIDVIEKDEIRIGASTYNIDLIQNMRDNHIELILVNRK